MSGAPTTRDLLSRCTAPRELRRLERGQLDQLAAQIRAFLIDNVSRTGGHLGPNLGVVELTIGLHRVFRSPQDTIVFDTGHQSYVHKLLTGRQDFSSLRSPGGLSGYPSRAESEHDVVESSHASSSARVGGWHFSREAPPRGAHVDGRRHRRRRSHGRPGLGGPQQHCGLQEPSHRHRRQRQWPLLRPDHRRPRGTPGCAAYFRRIREGPRLGQAAPPQPRHPRSGRLRRAPRAQVRHQGCAHAAGHVRGSGPEVHRSRQRARYLLGRDGAASGTVARRTRHRPHDH